jgi:O-antigen/teichoic acid export membrane protein
MRNQGSTIAKNSIFLMVSQVISKALGAIFFILAARYLGKVYFGRYSFVLAFVGVFMVFIDFGLGTLATREVARSKSKASYYLANILVIRIILSIVSAFFVVLIINLMHKSSDVVLGVYIAAAWLLINSLSNSYGAIFNAFERLDYSALLAIFQKAIIFGLGLYVLLTGHKIVALLLVVLCAEVVNAALAAYFVYTKFAKPTIEISLTFCKSLAIKAIPFAILAVFVSLYFKIDIIMLSIMKNDAVVGWYGAAYRLLEACMFIPVAMTAATYPVLSRLSLSSRNELQLLYEESFKILLLIALPISVGTTLLANKIVLFIYGADFINSARALTILIWAIVFLFENSLLGVLIYAIDKQKTLLWLSGVTVLLNISLNLILIPLLSYVGASITTLVCEIVVFAFAFQLISRYGYSIKLLSISYKPIIAVIGMGVFIYLLLATNINLLILIFLSALIYFLVLILLKAFTWVEAKIFFKGAPVIFDKHQMD